MKENTELSKEDKREKIEQQMVRIYKSYQIIHGNAVTKITYYNQLIISNQQSQIMYGLEDTFAVNLDSGDKKG